MVKWSRCWLSLPADTNHLKPPKHHERLVNAEAVSRRERREKQIQGFKDFKSKKNDFDFVHLSVSAPLR
jgi:hypothetical protein